MSFTHFFCSSERAFLIFSEKSCSKLKPPALTSRLPEGIIEKTASPSVHK